MSTLNSDVSELAPLAPQLSGPSANSASYHSLASSAATGGGTAAAAAAAKCPPASRPFQMGCSPTSMLPLLLIISTWSQACCIQGWLLTASLLLGLVGW